MIIEKEYRGMNCTTEEAREEFGYSIIYKYYRLKEELIDGSIVYKASAERTLIYNENEFLPEMLEMSIVVSTNKEFANQIIEIFRIHSVDPVHIEEIYDDLCYYKFNDKKINSLCIE